MSTTYSLAGITEEDCDMIAAALDFYLCNAEVPTDHKDPLFKWLLEFDLMADPDAFYEDLNVDNGSTPKSHVKEISGNLISVNFTNKTN